MQLGTPKQFLNCFQQCYHLKKITGNYIHKASQAYSNSLVYIDASSNEQNIFLVHLSSDCQLLWKRKLPKRATEFQMINSKQLILLSPQSSSVDIILLDTYKVLSVKHMFYSYLPQLIKPKVIYFKKSQLFCVIQKASSFDHQVTYFSLKTISQLSKPVVECKIKAQSDCQPFKLNQHSKIGFLSCLFEAINYFGQIQLSNAFQMRKREKKLQINQRYWHAFDCTCYQFRENLVLVFIQRKNLFQQIISPKLKKIQIHQQKDWQLKDYPLHINSSIYSQKLKLISMIPLQNYFLLNATNEKKEKICLFVDYESGEILLIERYKNEKAQYKNWGWDGNILIEEKRNDSKNIEITVKKYAQMKDIYLHLLLSLNEDWDDDLLGDAIGLLT